MKKWIIPFLTVMAVCGAAVASDWAQLQNGPADTGYTTDEPRPPYKVKWSRNLGEPLYPACNLIAADGKAFIGTTQGNVYALDAQTGKEVWKYPTGRPILSTCSYQAGRLYATSMDGACHAIDAKSGKPIWQFQTEAGLWASPVLADGKVFIGGRDGFVYAVDADSGKQVWKQPTTGPVMATPAYAPGADGKGVLYVPGGDVKVYAYRGEDGGPLWTSPQLNGAAIRDHWLVVANGVVIVSTQFAQPNKNHMSIMQEAVNPWIAEHKDDTVLVEDGVFPRVRDFFTKNFTERTIFFLDAATGQEKFIQPYVTCYGGGSPATPPSVDPDGWAYTVYSNVQIGASGCAFLGRMNLANGEFRSLLKDMYTGPTNFQGRPGHQPKGGGGWQNKSSDFHGSFAVSDHSWSTSVAGQTVFVQRDAVERCTRNFFDLRTGQVSFLVTQGDDVPLARGPFRQFNHSIVSPMTVSGKMLFHRSIMGGIDAFEGN